MTRGCRVTRCLWTVDENVWMLLSTDGVGMVTKDELFAMVVRWTWCFFGQYGMKGERLGGRGRL
jgi:hypothetical protein